MPLADPILLRNRAFHLARRDACYRQARCLLADLLTDFDGLFSGNEPSEDLTRRVDELCGAFKRTRDHALAAKGGDRTRFHQVTVADEELFVDHIKTMYSAAKNVKAYLRHEILLQRYLQEHRAARQSVREYIAQVGRSEKDAMHMSLTIMQRRVDLLDQLLSPGDSAHVHAS